MSHVANNSGNNEWYSPAWVVSAGRAALGGHIDCDPASSEIANRTVGAARYYTNQDNGLVQSWGRRVWMNPPYAQPLIRQFADALVARVRSGEVEEAVVLVNNATETKWFAALAAVASGICFLSRRVRFVAPCGSVVKMPLQGQVVLYVGHANERFNAAFTELGPVALFNRRVSL